MSETGNGGETASQFGGGWNFAALPSLCAHRTWLPPALQKIHNASLAMVMRNEPFVQRAGKLQEWHNQLSASVIASPAWSTLPLEFATHRPLPQNGNDVAAQTEEEMPDSRFVLSVPPINSNSRPVPTGMEDRRQPLGRRRAIESAGLQASEYFGTRFSNLRIEVPGGFPTEQIPDPSDLRAESATSKTIVASKESHSADEIPISESIRQPVVPSHRKPQGQLSVASSTPTGENSISFSATPTMGVIEKIIERAATPVRLPGVSFRPVLANGAAVTNQIAAKESQDPVRIDNPVRPDKAVPGSATAQPLDIDMVADKVYQTLKHRQQLERERRGIY
jgi:hypothetical protein